MNCSSFDASNTIKTNLIMNETKVQKEIWKDVVGYEESYKVSSAGNIKSKSRYVLRSGHLMYVKGQYIKTYLQKSGYYTFGLRDGYKYLHRNVQKIIAEAFIPNPENKRTVNHINGIKTDNRVENLEWATDSENTQHAYDKGMHPSKTFLNGRGFKNITIKLNKDTLEVLEVFDTLSLAALSMGTLKGNISKAARKGTVSCGYKWKYKY